jgi:hypothetical protein
MSNKREWAKAIHAYKHIITHYFACKMELWPFFLLSPVYVLLHCNGVYDFGKSRGGTHAHVIGYLHIPANQTIDTILAMWAEQAYFESAIDENAVSNTNGDEEVVAQAKATLDEQLQLFKSEAKKQLDDIFTS